MGLGNGSIHAVKRLTRITQGHPLRLRRLLPAHQQDRHRPERHHAHYDTTHNLWCGQRLCEQRDNNGTAIARYFPQGEIQNGKPYFYAQDQIGSVVAMVSPDGSVKGRTQYGPYGQIISQTGIQPHYGYAGLYHDTTNDLYLATWRAYDPQTGHWLKRDPIREAGGLNLYAYVGGKPTVYRDPNGHGPVLSAILLAAGTGMAGYQGYKAGQKYAKLQCETKKEFNKRQDNLNVYPSKEKLPEKLSKSAMLSKLMVQLV